MLIYDATQSNSLYLTLDSIVFELSSLILSITNHKWFMIRISYFFTKHGLQNTKSQIIGKEYKNFIEYVLKSHFFYLYFLP